MSTETKRILEEIKDLSKREQILIDQAVRKEKISLRVDFTDKEIEDLTEEQVKNAIALEKLEQEKKEFMDEWKDKANPKKERQKELLRDLDKGNHVVEMELYALQNFENDTMEYYDAEGFLKHERPLLQEEYQSRL